MKESSSIYVSSSCVRSETIADSVRTLSDAGFCAIELSGGTKPYEDMERDLLELKQSRNLEYRPHNYFPPPQTPFVLNLASDDEAVSTQSMDLIRNALRLCKLLGSKKFGFHAGFFMDIRAAEIGKRISHTSLNSTEEARQRFIQRVKELQGESQGVELYIENNVHSSTNAKTFGRDIPFMLLNFENYQELREDLDFKLLLDVAHLKVSCRSLCLPFEEQFHQMMEQSDYLHLSDNDGLHDTNGPLNRNSEMFALLKQHGLKGKTCTLEVYGEIQDLRFSYDLVREEFYA
ncbi:sugar phosphate isomerase/epimerase [bacterium]|jgi:sugar phosphate isomerase/epimerase|nr:sugar phosphate isomerase/epimerase [bacterium]